MNDPYEVLGVSQNSTPAEIKSAYIGLVKKYHPDKYQNNPLADLAEEKLQEVNEAYDIITKGGGRSPQSQQGYGQAQGYNGQGFGGFGQRFGGFGGFGGFGQGFGTQQTGGSQSKDPTIRAKYNEIRRYLDQGDLVVAEKNLVNMSSKDAEWFFLSGMLSYKKTWYDDALSNIKTAIDMDPQNYEYKRMYQAVANNSGGYRQRSTDQGYGGADGGDCCYAMPCLMCNPFCC